LADEQYTLFTLFSLVTPLSCFLDKLNNFLLAAEQYALFSLVSYAYSSRVCNTIVIWLVISLLCFYWIPFPSLLLPEQGLTTCFWPLYTTEPFVFIGSSCLLPPGIVQQFIVEYIYLLLPRQGKQITFFWFNLLVFFT
jgi:hypothetical protein